MPLKCPGGVGIVLELCLPLVKFLSTMPGQLLATSKKYLT